MLSESGHAATELFAPSMFMGFSANIGFADIPNLLVLGPSVVANTLLTNSLRIEDGNTKSFQERSPNGTRGVVINC